MIFRAITGGDEAGDIWPVVALFTLGIVCGGYLAIAAGHVDMAQVMGGETLRSYLTITTAMLAAALTFLVSRINDRITDRRSVRRKTQAAGLRLGRLAKELTRFRNAFEGSIPEGVNGLPSLQQAERLKVFLRSLDTATMDGPDFDDLLETDTDQEQAHRALWWFRYFSTHTDVIVDADAPLADQLPGLGRFLTKRRLDIALEAKTDLIDVKNYFERRADTL